MSASFFLASSYAGCNQTLVILFFSITVCSRSLITPGAYVNPVDLAPNYVGPLTAVVNGISSTTGVFGPYVAGLMTPNVRNDRRCKWWLVFLLLFYFFSITNSL